MRTLKNINDKYLISNGNNEVIYLKINKYEFTSFYDDYIGFVNLNTFYDKVYNHKFVNLSLKERLTGKLAL